MKKILFLSFLGGVSALQAKPNIVLIVADDLGYADTGFNGSKNAITPNLDRFAKSGVKLADFRACPMSSPTRAGLLTGRWPLRFGMMRAVIPPWSKYGLPLKEKTLPELLAKHAVAFINDSPKEKPYFLYLPFNAPHSPFQATKADLALHRSLKNKKRRTYAAMVTAMDRGIGKVLAAIESRLDADNTLVIFFSDNGGIPSAGSNAPWRGAKLNLYEGGTRVTAALRWPARGLNGGKTFSDRIGYLDILPTALRAAGVAPPKNLDGLNVLPALQGKAQLLERPWFSYLHQGKAASSSLHLGPWKLVVKGDAFSSAHALALELYNLDSDPGEKTTSPKNTPTESSPCFPKSKNSEPSKSPVPHPTTKAAKASSRPKTGSSSKEAQRASASSDDPLPNPKHSVSLRTGYRAESRRQVRDSIRIL